jgi:hypothetical protein
MNVKFLNSAIRKCHQFSRERNEWYGYLLPVEIVTLVQFGAKPTKSNEEKVEYARELIKKGCCNPMYFYFHPNNIVMKNS